MAPAGRGAAPGLSGWPPASSTGEGTGHKEQQRQRAHGHGHGDGGAQSSPQERKGKMGVAVNKQPGLLLHPARVTLEAVCQA